MKKGHCDTKTTAKEWKHLEDLKKAELRIRAIERYQYSFKKQKLVISKTTVLILL